MIPTLSSLLTEVKMWTHTTELLREKREFKYQIPQFLKSHSPNKNQIPVVYANITH